MRWKGKHKNLSLDEWPAKKPLSSVSLSFSVFFSFLWSLAQLKILFTEISINSWKQNNLLVFCWIWFKFGLNMTQIIVTDSTPPNASAFMPESCSVKLEAYLLASSIGNRLAWGPFLWDTSVNGWLISFSLEVFATGVYNSNIILMSMAAKHQITVIKMAGRDDTEQTGEFVHQLNQWWQMLWDCFMFQYYRNGSLSNLHRNCLSPGQDFYCTGTRETEK